MSRLRSFDAPRSLTPFPPQWMIKLVESDVPESVLDSEVTPPVSRKWRKGSARKMYFGDQARGWNEGQTDLVDLAVLTFPRLNVPRFKVMSCLSILTAQFPSNTRPFPQLSHLRLQVDISKKTGISAKRRADVILGACPPAFTMSLDVDRKLTCA